MKTLRFIMLVLILGAVLVSGAGAQNPDGEPVKITVERDTLKPGEKTTVYIDLDFRTRPPIRESESAVVRAIFSVYASRGTITHSTITYGEWAPSSGWYVIAPNLDRFTRAQSHIEVIFEAPAQAGEVLITVDGRHGGAPGGLASLNYRGLKRINVLPTPGADVGEPAHRPPFTPTPDAVNPTVVMLGKAAGLAALLAVTTLIIYTVKRKRRKRMELKQEVPHVEPKVEVSPKLERKKREPEQQGQVVLDADPYALDGNGDGWIHLTATAIPVGGGPATILYAQFGADLPGYVPEALPQAGGQSTRQARVRVPWEWRDMEVRFTVQVEVEGWAAPAHGSSRPVRINGAKPEFVVEANPPVVSATGRNGIDLTAQLWLFDEPAPAGEDVRISRAVASTNPRWDHLSLDGPAAGKPGQATWIPPFLLQDPEYVELADLEVTCEWIGGAMWKRASASREGMQPIHRIHAVKQEIMISGCRASAQPEIHEFVPLPGTELPASGRLTDAQGKEVENPFGFGAVHSPDAGIRFEVRDRSQGLPKLHNGCKLPPSEPTPFITRPRIEVDEHGRFFTPGGPAGPDGKPLIVFSKYQVREGHEPIHHGPVEYVLVVDDGFGGIVELKGGCHAVLGSLVMETGGPDFRIYENRAYSLDLEYQSDVSYFPAGECRLLWSFAVVNEQTGEPVRFAGSLELPATIDPGHRKANLIIGHTPKEYDIHVEPSSAEVRYVKAGAGPPPGGWYRIGDADRERAARLRGAWHGLRGDYGAPAAGIPGLSPRPSKTWRKMALALAVRTEMRDQKGNLLATSDRIMPDNVRTPSEFVWRDHRFKFVFRLPILFIPGFEGSQLNAGTERLWPPAGPVPDETLEKLLKKLELDEKGQAPEEPGAEVRPVDLVYRDGAEGEVYHGLIEGLMTELGYWEADTSLPAGSDRSGGQPSGTGEHLGLFLMPYDWRLDNREHERELARGIDALLQSYYPGQVEPRHRWVLLLAHDMGGLIAWHFGRNSADRFPFMAARKQSGPAVGEQELTGEEIWNDHVAACVMLGPPTMGTAEPLFRLFTGKAPVPGQNGGSALLDKIDKDGKPAHNVRDLLRNLPSIYQLSAPYYPFVRIEAEGQTVEQPVPIGQLQDVVDACVANLLQQEIEDGNGVINLAAALGFLSEGYVLSLSGMILPFGAQPVRYDSEGRVVLWPNKELLRKGRDFHEEKGPQPPPRCLILYGKGGETVDSVTLKIEAKHALRLGLKMDDLLLMLKEKVIGFAVDAVRQIFGGESSSGDVRLLEDKSADGRQEEGGPEGAGQDAGSVRFRIEGAPKGSLSLVHKLLNRLGIPISISRRFYGIFEIKLGLVKVITMKMVEQPKLGAGDGTVPVWSILARDERNAVDLQSDLPLYGILVGETGKGTGGTAIRHAGFGSHASVREIIRSIMAGIMPDPDEPTPGFGYRMPPRVRMAADGKETEALVRSKKWRAIFRGILKTIKAIEEIKAGQGAGHAARFLGKEREQKVAALVGGKVSGEKIKTSRGSTDVDVEGPNGELIAVGGKGKARNLSNTARSLMVMKEIADQRGVPAKAYFTRDTPQVVIDLAKRKLGPDNVHLFDENI